jgi:pimeloyl-ACP methyl ester carboxylesterase
VTATDPTGDFAGLVDAGDHRRLYLHCRGSGSPTVILESGYGHSGRVWDTDVLSTGWQAPDAPRTTVFAGVSESTRVCLYDRPGTILPNGAGIERSRSDPAPMPRDARALVNDLRSVLAAAGIFGPYVLVGHSLGGLLARVHAVRYPDEVVGLVLVDAFSAELWERFERALSPEDWAALQHLEEGPRIELQTVYPEVELVDLKAATAQERASTEESPLAPMPLAVLTRGRPLSDVVPAEAVPDGFAWDTVEREALAAQHSLATLMPDARHVIAKESGHLIQLDQPELVIEAIRDVVEAVRDSASWT